MIQMEEENGNIIYISNWNKKVVLVLLRYDISFASNYTRETNWGGNVVLYKMGTDNC